ncbi:2-methoxy-6-polyprenyl-1,4-benzoquinol methylase, mitochondrial-like [Lineus longissimus]|uniref:2-methoxy-6-polyprenyl-1,4-benzoquinol methylase, mitochondrial-like n=1 Tax=Lineus longissimus TaxID=88925 RepID=UPI002B4D9795
MTGLVRRLLRRELFSSVLLQRNASISHASYSNDREAKEEPENTTHFGFETVTEEEKEQKVYDVFENVSEKYDLMNDAMSAGVHRLWKDYFISRLAPLPGTKLLDVAGGTGDIAFRFLQYAKSGELEESKEDFDVKSDVLDKSGRAEGVDGASNPEADDGTTHVTVCDINQAMLDVGKRKADMLGQREGVTWIRGNAEHLPMPDDTYDAYTIAFGIRNCTHIEKVLEEAYRVLKPGGRFMCLEFSHVPNPLIKSLYDLYSFQVIPVMGQVLAADWKSYQYLVESIRKFPDQQEFSYMIEDAGFSVVKHENLSFGVAAIHSGFKL